MTTELAQRASWLAALALAVSGWIGCSSPSSEGTIYIDEKKIPEDMRSDYQSFAVNCSKCHSLARAFGANVTEASHWDLYVARMMRTAGSAISPAEKPHILRFLHWYTDTYVPAEKAAGAEKALSRQIPSQEPAAVATESDSASITPEAPVPTPNTSAAPDEAPAAPPSATEVPATPPAEVQ